MKKSILLASLLAAVALTACSKKEEPKVEAPVVAEPAPAPAMDAASSAASAAVDAAASAVDAASAASQ